MSSFIHDLEDKCRQIVHKLTREPLDSSPVTFVGREMAVLLDQIDNVREQQKALKAQFLEKALQLGTQILNLDSRPSLKNNWLEQTRLRDEYTRRIDSAKWQHRRLAMDYESTLRQLHLRLLELLNMYDQLTPKDGNTKATA